MARKTTSPPGAKKLQRVGGLSISPASRQRMINDLNRDPQKKITQTVNGVKTRVSPFA